MKPKHQRLLFVFISVALLISAAIFVMQAFRENLIFFYSPTDLKSATLNAEQKIRVGGLVETGSIKKGADDAVSFIITDGSNQLIINYKGLLPALFREGQGVVAEGNLNKDGQFSASTILAKHDENYMPKEVVDSLKRTGHWHDR